MEFFFSSIVHESPIDGHELVRDEFVRFSHSCLREFEDISILQEDDMILIISESIGIFRISIEHMWESIDRDIVLRLEEGDHLLSILCFRMSSGMDF